MTSEYGPDSDPENPPTVGEQSSEPPKKPRRGPLTLEQRLTALVEQRRAQLEKIVAREAALVAELEAVRAARAVAEEECRRIDIAKGG